MSELREYATWDEGVGIPRFPELKESTTTDVVIVGGGITGITAAYLLAKAGKKIILVEKDRLIFGATGATTAFLTSYIDTAAKDLVSIFGKEKSRNIYSSHSEAIDSVEAIVRNEKIECEFMRCSNYVYANSEKDVDWLRKEYDALSQVGQNIVWKEKEDLPFKQGGSIEIISQAKFHPRKYLAVLLEKLVELGVKIYENTEVVGMEEKNGVVSVRTEKNKITATNVLQATYVPLGNKLFFKKAYYSSYVYEVQMPAGTLPEGIYEDTLDPYHYFRVDRVGGRDRIIIGGEDHRSDVPVPAEKNYAALEKYITETFSRYKYEIVGRWSGPIIEQVDGLAFIGPVDSSAIFYATGFSGNGMTYSMIAAQMFADHVLVQRNKWDDLYDASRTPSPKALLRKGRDYGEEFFGGAVKNIFKKN